MTLRCTPTISSSVQPWASVTATSLPPGVSHGRYALTREQCRSVDGSAHVGIGVVGRRDQRLLDRPGAGPAQQVLRCAGLVVGAAGPRAAERLLTDDRAGGLLVDVEVARREPQELLRPGNGRAVLGDDRSGQ